MLERELITTENDFSSSVGSLLPTLTENPALFEDQVRIYALVKEKLSQVANPNNDLNQRIDMLLSLNSEILPALIMEVFQENPSILRSNASSKALSAVRDYANLLFKKRELDFGEEFNPSSPKMRIVFGWFIELLYEVVRSYIKNEVLLSSIFNDLAIELGGWEEKVDKKLRGNSLKVLEEMESPFVKNFRGRAEVAAKNPSFNMDLDDPNSIKTVSKVTEKTTVRIVEKNSKNYIKTSVPGKR